MDPDEKLPAAAQLNNKIVRMRPIIRKAKVFAARTLIKNIQQLKRRQNKTDKITRKIDRYLEELKALKAIKLDDASKSALVNTKTLAELKITNETPVSERALYKLITQSVVVDSVDDFRARRPQWHVEVPFMLQRLGLQRHQMKARRAAMKKAAMAAKMAAKKSKRAKPSCGVVTNICVDTAREQLELPKVEVAIAKRSSEHADSEDSDTLDDFFVNVKSH